MSTTIQTPGAGALERKSIFLQDGHYVAPPEDNDGWIRVRTSAIIQADADTLYQLWHHVEKAPQWQEQLKEVVITGPNTSHWVLLRGNTTIAWDAEVVNDEPGKRIAWRSTGGDLETAGEVTFAAAPTGRGTMVTLLQEFKVGKLASAWETLVGRNPKQGVIENLRHFKALAETGEIPRTQGQPHGPRGASGSLKESAYGEKVPSPTGTISNNERIHAHTGDQS